MGNWHQDIVVMDVADHELEVIATLVVEYLLAKEIISSEMSDNVLGSEEGYCPGKNWEGIVQYPEERDFLGLWTNGLEVIKGRNVFYTDGGEFEAINCPNCGANNLECDWGELFGKWIDDLKSAELECLQCENASSISEYIFEPTWALSNLGFVFWNWPILKDSFISELQKVVGKRILFVAGKL